MADDGIFSTGRVTVIGDEPVPVPTPAPPPKPKKRPWWKLLFGWLFG